MSKRSDKIKAASQFRVMIARDNGRGRDDLLDSYRLILKMIRGK